jgi:hypothetical protein
VTRMTDHFHPIRNGNWICVFFVPFKNIFRLFIMNFSSGRPGLVH